MCLNINETDTFEFFQAKPKYKINHHLNCNDNCLIYLLSCKVCGLQYVGSTTDKFHFRWNNYEENDRKSLKGEEEMHPELFQHFPADYHNYFLNDCSITLIDKTDSSDPTRREEYCRKVIKRCRSLWVEYFRLISTSAHILIYFSEAGVPFT